MMLLSKIITFFAAGGGTEAPSNTEVACDKKGGKGVQFFFISHIFFEYILMFSKNTWGLCLGFVHLTLGYIYPQGYPWPIRKPFALPPDRDSTGDPRSPVKGRAAI